MSFSLVIVLCMVVLGLTAAVLFLVRELVLRSSTRRVLPPPPSPRSGPTVGYPQGSGPVAPVRWPPRVDHFGELEDP